MTAPRRTCPGLWTTGLWTTEADLKAGRDWMIEGARITGEENTVADRNTGAGRENAIPPPPP